MTRHVLLVCLGLVAAGAARAADSASIPPPAGATVLFDGRNLDAWSGTGGQPAGWTLTGDGAMEVAPGKGSIVTREAFGDCALHVEFRTPSMPDAKGQGRGNSGVYLQGRYEVQVLDSHGEPPAKNGCGAIYGIAAPATNVCAPPMAWQTYDIEFTAPRFDAAAKKSANARMTVRHNDVLVHDGVEAPGPTTAALDRDESSAGGGLMLQDHGNKVQYRNVWMVRKAPSGAVKAEEKP